MTTRDDSENTAAGAVSRREFFAGAGMTAGALATIGAIGGLSYTPAARSAMLKSRHYYSSFVALELDGKYAGNLVSAEGGEPVIVPAKPATTALTATQATLRYEPLRLRLGDMSAPVFKWMEDASRGTFTRKQVSVISYDLNGKETYRLAAHDVSPVSIMTNGFEAASKELLRFDVELAPTTSAHEFGGTSNPVVKSGLKSKAILRSKYRLYVQGYESTTLQVHTINPFGLNAGPDAITRFDGIKNSILVPTPLRFTMPFGQAAPMFNWMKKTLEGTDGPRQAELQILSADLTKAVATVAFQNLAILRVSAPAQAGTEVQPFVEVECQPGSLAFNMGELLS
jgi:hypothetical protein